jgi:uncharacterized protein (TIGR03000 family)
MTVFRLALVGAVTAVAFTLAAAQEAGKQPISIELIIPADAQVEFDGQKTTQTGEVRTFDTPALSVGREYHYALTVTSQGKVVKREITVSHQGQNRFDLRPDFVAARAAGPSTAEPSPPADQEVVKSVAVPQAAAASVNFRKELNLPFPSLTTLGGRIDAARRAPDPVVLANAASELKVAEQVSGKTASLTSKQVLQEAAELATLRRQDAELQAVLHVSDQVMFEEDRVANLRKQIALAQAQTKADQQAFQQNQQPTAAPRQVVVNNYTTQYIDVYVNGFYKTQVLPGTTQVLTIEHRWNPTVLKGYGNEDMSTWGPRYIWGEFTKYTWNLN